MELGFGEIVVIAAIVLLLFGPTKLPQLGEALGRGIRNFKDGMAGKDEEAGAATSREPALPPEAQASERQSAPPEQHADRANGVPAGR
jgi:sec-independent protein translocase protein TatA